MEPANTAFFHRAPLVAYRKKGMLQAARDGYQLYSQARTNAMLLYEDLTRTLSVLTLSLPGVSKLKIEKKVLIIMEKQTVHMKVIQLSFEWSHTGVSSTDLKVRNTIIYFTFMLDSGSERVIECFM